MQILLRIEGKHPGEDCRPLPQAPVNLFLPGALPSNKALPLFLQIALTLGRRSLNMYVFGVLVVLIIVYPGLFREKHFAYVNSINTEQRVVSTLEERNSGHQIVQLAVVLTVFHFCTQ